MQLFNYLFFTTACEQALAFYEQCGLGRVTEMSRHGEGAEPMANEGMCGRIMHAKFEGPGVTFYASDNDDAEPMRGSAHLLIVETRERMTSLLQRLAEGGGVTTALGVQPWGYYGKLTDQFGVQWMFTCAA